ncbi:MAG: MCE family protein [Myxococcales bacterium]|nr:MCE family protein [Myxococcales bacterium]
MRGVWILVLGLLACGGTTYTAELDHASGLHEGSPVELSGVRVGEVTGVAVAGEKVHVSFGVGREHELALHADACVIVNAAGPEASLTLMPGDAGAWEAGTLPACQLSNLVGDLGQQLDQAVQAVRQLAPDARELGQTLGQATREFTEGLAAGLEPPAP